MPSTVHMSSPMSTALILVCFDTFSNFGLPAIARFGSLLSPSSRHQLPAFITEQEDKMVSQLLLGHLHFVNIQESTCCTYNVSINNSRYQRNT